MHWKEEDDENEDMKIMTTGDGSADAFTDRVNSCPDVKYEEPTKSAHTSIISTASKNPKCTADDSHYSL